MRKKDAEQERPGPPHLALIFPPVWIPILPHLAILALTGYLKEKGFRVTPLDTNVDFFTKYLLKTETLEPFLLRAHQILGGDGGGPDIPQAWMDLLKRELPLWESSVSNVDRLVSVFRQPNLFFDPNRILPALDQTMGLLHLCSIAQWPGRITFIHYHREDIRTLQDLLQLCEDPERNIFLPFFQDEVIPKLRQTSPTAVGISISCANQFVASMTLARLIRRQLPHVHVVVGGKRLLNIRESTLSDPFMFKNFFHSAVLFEGERPLERLLPALQGNGSLHKVPNLMYLEDERVVTTESTEPVPLDALPYVNLDDSPWGKYLAPVRYTPVRMAEGCYWGKCTFCGRYGPQGAVFIPPDRVLDELEYLGEVHGIHDISVNDDCLPPSYWEKIAEGIIKRRLTLSMLVWAKPVGGFTRPLLQKMARAGVRQIRWGVESANPRILTLMRKGTNAETTLRVLRDAHDVGIWNHTCIILGFPTETKEEALETLKFVKSNRPIIQSFILNPFELLRNSYIYDHPEEFGIRDLEAESTPLYDRISYTAERGMSAKETQALVQQAKWSLLEESYGWPFWYYLKLREYLQLYLDHYGLKGVLKMDFRRDGLRRFFFKGWKTEVSELYRRDSLPTDSISAPRQSCHQ